jgi:tRNA (cmo5U34)-methyltransferase
MSLEKMNEFFDQRADIYDNHMLAELQLSEFYEVIAECFTFDTQTPKLLDLGCGTGLQLERLFLKCPELSVTGIDLSREMLRILESKYPDKPLTLLCASYFDVDLGEGIYDAALSTYSLHHFDEAVKTNLYKKIHAALRDGGTFVEGDYTCKTEERMKYLLAENERLRKEAGISGGFYHFDTPFTPEKQRTMLKAAGFRDVTIVKEWDNTSIFVARK